MDQKTRHEAANMLLAAAKKLEEGAKVQAKRRKPYKSKQGVVYDDPVYAHIYAAADKIFDASHELSDLLTYLAAGEDPRGLTPQVKRSLGRFIGSLNKLGLSVYETKHRFE